MSIVLLIVGLLVLIAGGELLVRGAAGIALKSSIPPLIVGLTVVSIGTSAPEVFASVRAAWEGNPGLAVGNVLGSNIANITLILGITALIRPVAVDRSLLRMDYPVLIVATCLFLYFAHDLLFTKVEGVILLLGLAGLLVFLAQRARSAKRVDEGNKEASEADSFSDFATKGYGMLFSLVVAGTVLLYFGSEWFIDGARRLAREAGMSDHVIGVTVVAFGTSVPELVTSAVAALRRQSNLCLGNLLGSNIFNILLAMGATAVIHPVAVDAIVLLQDQWWMLAAVLILLPMMLHRGLFHRWKGVVLLVFYIGYIGVQLV
jgi:cation:H+ antiporter